jgi:hypothetical protein
VSHKLVWTRVGTAVAILLVASKTLAGPPTQDAPTPLDDDALLRIQAEQQRFPAPDSKTMAAWDEILRLERQRWAPLLPGGQAGMMRRQIFDAKVGDVSAQPWVNVGPTTALFEYNGNNFAKFDSGRPNKILVDPRDANVVYVATAMGGLWKSYDFLTGDPTWHPAGDTLNNLSLGAADLDPSHPDTIYVASGDSFESVSGGAVTKSNNGGSTWSAPVTLIVDLSVLQAGWGTYRPNAVRDLRVEPTTGTILVASSLGLFRSIDGGATFQWIDLPNGAKKLTEVTWSLAYLGGTSWLISGVSACDQGQFPYTTATIVPGAFGCTLGALGDVWRSNDSGATWTSLRNTAGALPSPNGGRITLAAGQPKTDATKTVVYAMVSNLQWDGQSNTSATLGFWRSIDGGQTWSDMGGTLANPTFTPQGGTADCGDLNIGRGQTWYNEALAVDPRSDDGLIAGGQLCSIRTLNATSAQPVWQNVSHWLPFSSSGGTVDGALPYAHADWHTMTAANINGQARVFVGNDGGVYSSSNVLDGSTAPTQVVWNQHNKGLTTHLMYAVGSGDPAWGDPLIALTGLQDNGTFIRAQPATPTVFTGVFGGDGIGTAVNKGSVGEFYWVSTYNSHIYCFVQEGGCTGSSPYWWWEEDPPIDNSDGFPFFTPYSPLWKDPTGVGFLTVSNHFVWQTNLAKKADGTYADPYDCGLTTDCKLTWQAASQDFTSSKNSVIQVTAARNIDKLYGAVLSGANPVAVTADGGATQWKLAAPLPGGLTAQAMDFPLTAVTPGLELTVASSSASAPVNVGHVFHTVDGGQTWTPINGCNYDTGKGACTGPSPLPNLPVYALKYDPMTANTIYVGTIIGVYVTRDGGATWARLGSGLPFVEVRDLYIASNLDFIRIATYGRGLWEIYPTASEPAGARGDGDYDRNLQLDWVDLAAVASRLGDTPGTSAVPMYTYICDITSDADANGLPVNAIDDGDLSAVLGKLGDHP